VAANAVYYLRTGVKMVWLIDPEARSVTVHQPDRGQLFLEPGQELNGGEVLPGFVCRVDDLFDVPGA